MSHPESTGNYTFKCDKQLHHVAEKLSALYRGKELCDTTLIAGADNTEVKTHRLVLYLSSEYFRTIFDSGLEESKPEVIHLSTIDSDTLKKVIGFMYTFEIQMSKESIENVLNAATLFQMKSLIEGCCDLMAGQLNASNCLRFVDLAEQNNYTKLYKKSLSYAYNNFEELSDGEEFLKLTESQLSKFLSQDGVNVVSQEILFLSLIKWLKHDQEAREESMYILLNDFVRFAQLDLRFISQNADSLAHIAKCSKLLFSWFNWHLSNGTPKKQEKQEIVLSRENKKKQKIILAYCFPIKDVSRFRADSYDPDLKKWSEDVWPQPSTIRRFYGMVITPNECFIAGGVLCGDYTYLSSIECLDLKSMKWRYLAPMLKERSNFAMTILNGSIYVVGGCNRARWIRSVERYDFTDGKWTNLADLPEALDRPRAVSISGRLYVSDNEKSFLWCYDPDANKWSKTEFKNERSSGFGLISIKEYVYAVGGIFNSDYTNTVERYNPANNTWTILKPMTIKRAHASCLTMGDKLLVCGGSNTSHRLIFEEYNDKTNEWKDLAQWLQPFQRNGPNSWYNGSDHFSIIQE